MPVPFASGVSIEAMPEPSSFDCKASDLPRKGLLRRGRASVASSIDWAFGLAALFVGLSVLAAIPIVQFLTLGYLLEASGRVARSGRLRDAFIGVRMAARIGGIALGSFALWLPLYGMSYLAERARILDPLGTTSRQWEGWLIGLTVLYALHVSSACLRDGRLRSFSWPSNVLWLLRRFLKENILRVARDRLWEATVSLRLPYYFWLGLRGFVGAFLWLLVPVALLAQGHRLPIAAIAGGFFLAYVASLLPFLQTRFARDGRFRAFLEVRKVRRDYRVAPFSIALVLCFHLLSAIPLYLLKIEVIPRDLMYLEGLIFLAFIFPARVFDGWAIARVTRSSRTSSWFIRALCRLGSLPAIAVYVLVVFASQHIGWFGAASLFEQHAFLLPVPFAKQ